MASRIAESAEVGGENFNAARLERVFDACFGEDFETCLRGGAVEPLYQPASEPGQPNVLWYREDFFASALHEVAHWCIAGDQRRRQVDFGYWYAPDGRDAGQQAAFEAVEAAPQALEWVFSLACGYRFLESTDNLDAGNGCPPETRTFRRMIAARAARWQREGLPARAGRFYNALRAEFGTGSPLAGFSFCQGLS